MTVGERQRSTGRGRALLAAIGIAVAGGLAGCASPQSDRPGGVEISTTGSDSPFAGSAVDVDLSLPLVRLTDTEGQPYDLAEDSTAPVTVVFFGYTNCPDLCGLALGSVASALRRVEPSVRADVQMVFITVDPARDTPAVIDSYLAAFGFPSYVGLTGELSTIKQAADDLYIALAGTKQVDGGYDVIHGTQIYGFDAAGKARVYWTDSTAVDDIAHDLTLLATRA